MNILSTIVGFLVTRLMDNLLVLFAILFIAIVIDIYLYRQYLEDKSYIQRAKTSWPKTIGKVTSARRHDGSGYSTAEGSVAGSHYNMITYSYEVGSKSYKKTEYVNTDRSFLDRFPQDTEVTVFYNPQHPKDAMWEYRTEPNLGVLILIDIILFIFSILAVLINP